MHHQAQNCSCGILVGIAQHKKGYLVHVPHTRKIISLYDVIFYEILSSALEYTSQPYSDKMAMQMDVTYIAYATSSKEKTGDIITFTQFEEVNLLSESHNGT